MACNIKKALIYDTGKGNDRYTIFLCKNVFMAGPSKIIGKLGTTNEIQPCTCLGKRIRFEKLPQAVQAAVRKRARWPRHNGRSNKGE